MGKAYQNKLKKRAALLDSAYELFSTKGIAKTTIREIADNAGVAKGTFYLYYTDKSDILDALVSAKATSLLQEACISMEKYVSSSLENVSVQEKFIYIMDYIFDFVAKDPFYVSIVSKFASWVTLTKNRSSLGPEPDVSDAVKIEESIRKLLEADNVKIRDLNLLLFNLLGMIRAFTYDIIAHEQPMPLEEFRPHLHRLVELLVNDAMIEE